MSSAQEEASALPSCSAARRRTEIRGRISKQWIGKRKRRRRAVLSWKRRKKKKSKRKKKSTMLFSQVEPTSNNYVATILFINLSKNSSKNPCSVPPHGSPEIGPSKNYLSMASKGGFIISGDKGSLSFPFALREHKSNPLGYYESKLSFSSLSFYPFPGPSIFLIPTIISITNFFSVKNSKTPDVDLTSVCLSIYISAKKTRTSDDERLYCIISTTIIIMPALNIKPVKILSGKILPGKSS